MTSINSSNGIKPKSAKFDVRTALLQAKKQGGPSADNSNSKLSSPRSPSPVATVGAIKTPPSSTKESHSPSRISKGDKSPPKVMRLHQIENKAIKSSNTVKPLNLNDSSTSYDPDLSFISNHSAEASQTISQEVTSRHLAQYESQISSLTDQVNSLQFANAQLEDLLHQTTEALKEYAGKYQVEKKARDALEEELLYKEEQIHSLQKRIKNFEHRSSSVHSLNIEELRAVSEAAEKPTAAVDEVFVKVYSHHEEMKSSIKDITESLCEQLVVLEQVIHNERLAEILRKYEEKPDPYKSTKGWQAKKNKNTPTSSAEDMTKFDFGKPSERFDIESTTIDEEEYEEDHVVETEASDDLSIDLQGNTR